MNAATTAKSAAREKAPILARLSEKEIDRFAQRIGALVGEPGAIERLCTRIDALLAGSEKLQR